MKIVVCGATGFVGRHLVPALLDDQHQVLVVGRDTNKAQNIFKKTVNYLNWDQLDQASPDEFDAIINLSGENIAEHRWTPNLKKRIKQSRVNSTKKIISWCLKSKNKKPHIYNASAIGIYGLQTSQKNLPEQLTESSDISFGNPSDFLSDVGQAWEGAANPAIADGFPVTFMRFAVVLKRNEGILKKLETPFYFGLGCILGNGDQAFTWIDIDDLIRVILFLLHHPEITGAVNLCSPQCVSQRDFARTLANIMHRPLFLKMPKTLIKILFGEMGEALLLGGQHVYPKRLKELGFEFLYPDLHSALLHEWTR
jgi:uncharacterized protein (TIGR01777 family)